eukprot:SAG31_NODE_270_length_18732_cov_9.342618_12_plen_82_part_00
MDAARIDLAGATAPVILQTQGSQPAVAGERARPRATAHVYEYAADAWVANSFGAADVRVDEPVLQHGTVPATQTLGWAQPR